MAVGWRRPPRTAPCGSGTWRPAGPSPPGAPTATSSGPRSSARMGGGSPPSGAIRSRLWDVAKGTVVASLRGHTSGIHSLAYRSDGKVLATGGDFPDQTVRLWDAESGAPLAV